MWNEEDLVLSDLPYPYDGLEPWISKDIMELHHKKHHQAYLNGLKGALQQAITGDPEHQLTRWIRLQPEFQFHGGGHINHSLFWPSLCPVKDGGGIFPESGTFYEKIVNHFGSFDILYTAFLQCALSLKGSGWTWLALKDTDFLLINTSNQTPLLPAQGSPLLGIDMWEHAYYLQYKNAKADYLAGIWKVINWKEIERRFSALS